MRDYSYIVTLLLMSQMVIVATFALYICAMASMEKMSSGNVDHDTAFVSNCDHNYNYMAYIQSIV